MTNQHSSYMTFHGAYTAGMWRAKGECIASVLYSNIFISTTVTSIQWIGSRSKWMDGLWLLSPGIHCSVCQIYMFQRIAWHCVKSDVVMNLLCPAAALNISELSASTRPQFCFRLELDSLSVDSSVVSAQVWQHLALLKLVLQPLVCSCFSPRVT